jgi:hypothetical protein
MLNSTMDKLHKRFKKTQSTWPNSDKYWKCENDFFSSKWDSNETSEKSVESRQEQQFSLQTFFL